MTDTELAKANLSGHTLCLVKDGKITVSDKRGVSPLIEIIEKGEKLSGYSVADKIVGKAGALLYSLTEVEEVHAVVLSESAEKVFKERGIKYSYETLTPKIINRKGDGICPMEETVENINSPEQAFKAIKEKLEKLKS